VLYNLLRHCSYCCQPWISVVIVRALRTVSIVDDEEYQLCSITVKATIATVPNYGLQLRYHCSDWCLLLLVDSRIMFNTHNSSPPPPTHTHTQTYSLLLSAPSWWWSPTKLVVKATILNAEPENASFRIGFRREHAERSLKRWVYG
jgi:hypothetical protein